MISIGQWGSHPVSGGHMWLVGVTCGQWWSVGVTSGQYLVRGIGACINKSNKNKCSIICKMFTCSHCLRRQRDTIPGESAAVIIA